jgi:hypothetical protein
VEASDPLAYHKLVEGADVKAWLRSVNNGRFDRPAYTRLADTMTWWELSTINLDDLELDGTDANAGGADPETDEELVIYARAFSHFCTCRHCMQRCDPVALLPSVSRRNSSRCCRHLTHGACPLCLCRLL